MHGSSWDSKPLYLKIWSAELIITQPRSARVLSTPLENKDKFAKGLAKIHQNSITHLSSRKYGVFLGIAVEKSLGHTHALR